MLKETLQFVGENSEVTIMAMFVFGLGLAFSKKTGAAFKYYYHEV